MEQESRKNLKNGKDKLLYYRRVDTGNVNERFRVKAKKDGEIESQLLLYPEQERVFFTEEDIKAISLDKYGTNIPYMDGELTILNNYFFDFWSYYLGAEGVALYAHLKRYTYGSKDLCFPNLQLIGLKMGKSRPTILNYMEILEKYGFIMKFNVLNEDKDMKEESPIYKIRKKIPLLTEKLIYGDPNLQIPETEKPHIKKVLEKEKEGLPELLRKEHEKFVKEKLEQAEQISIDDFIDYEEIFEKLMENKNRVQFKRKNNQTRGLLKANQIKINMTAFEKEILETILQTAEKKISKPSFDVWFKNLLLKKEGRTYILYASNEFTKDWLRQQYQSFIKEIITQLDTEYENIEYRAIN